MKLPVYNCEIEDSVNDITGIYAISFVDLPANEVDFVALKNNRPVYLDKNSKKQVLTGVVLKPEQLIYRNSTQLGEYYIKFSADQIEKIAQKMMKTGVALYNTTHQHESQLKGNYLTELWIVENPDIDKSKALGFQELPKGTLMCSYKIEDKSYWNNEVMSGNVRGFSLEGFFNQELNMSKITNTKRVNMKKKKFNFNAVKRGALLLAGLTREELSEIESIEEEDTTQSSEAYLEFTLKDGKIVKVDDTGYATLDGEQMPAGEHPLADGNILVIDENGNFVETKESSAAKTDPDDVIAKDALKKANLSKAKKQKLEEENTNNADPSTVADLEAKIEEMQATIDALAKALDDATKTVEDVKEVAEELKKKTPSAAPVVQAAKEIKTTNMSPTERMAHVANLAMQRKQKK